MSNNKHTKIKLLKPRPLKIKDIEEQFSIIEGRYYQSFMNWFERSCFVGYGIETALYHAYIAGRLDQQIIVGGEKWEQNLW